MRPTTEAWRTALTAVSDGSILYRGRPVQELVETSTIEEVVATLLFGSADPGVCEVVRRTLVAAADHGVAAPSIVTTRVVASTGAPVAAAIGAGLAAFAGPAHGGAAQECAEFLLVVAADASGPAPLDDVVASHVRAALKAGRRIPGFGHPVHSRDPRVEPLMATPLPVDLHREIARKVEEVLVVQRSARLTMNADAAVAALFLDAGLGADDVTAVTAIGRAIGLAAHAREERRREEPFRAPSPDAITYDGPEDPR